MATFTAFAQQSRNAGTYISGTVTYDGTSGLTCTAQLVDPNWTTTDLNSLIVTIQGEENFNLSAGVNDPNWLVVIGPYSWSPPIVGKGGSLPSAEFGMPNGGDGGGQRLVRLKLTISDIWAGGVTVTIV